MAEPTEIRVLPMDLQPGDRLADERISVKRPSNEEGKR